MQVLTQVVPAWGSEVCSGHANLPASHTLHSAAPVESEYRLLVYVQGLQLSASSVSENLPSGHRAHAALADGFTGRNESEIVQIDAMMRI